MSATSGSDDGERPQGRTGASAFPPPCSVGWSEKRAAGAGGSKS